MLVPAMLILSLTTSYFISFCKKDHLDRMHLRQLIYVTKLEALSAKVELLEIHRERCFGVSTLSREDVEQFSIIY